MVGSASRVGSVRFSLLLAVACSLPAMAQNDGREAPDPVFEGESRVVSVDLPVNVTTRNGEPVLGLTAENFEIIDDGKKRPISGLEVHSLDVVEVQEQRLRRAEIDSLPPAARRHFMMLFDFSFSSPTAVVRARQAARNFIESSLHPADLVAVATYSLETGPRLLVTFTPDRSQVARAIDTLGVRRPREGFDPLQFIIETPERQQQAVNQDSSRTEVQTQGRDAATAALEIILNQMNRSERSFERSKISRFSDDLGTMAQRLGSVEGRKHVILFSEGFDSSLLLGSGANANTNGTQQVNQDIARGQTWTVDTDTLYGNTELQGDLREMIRAFRRADCVIQAVDIGGLRAETGGNADGPINSGQEGLFYMANETGGNLFRNANNLESQLAEVLERTKVTYVLSFQPDDLKFDGSYRRLKVRLKGDQVPRGARLSHRAGYYEPRPFAELHPFEKSLLAASAIASPTDAADLDLDVLVTAFRATSDWAYVPVILELDGESLLTEQEGDEMQLELYAYVTDDHGEMRDFFSQLVGFDLSQRATRDKLRKTGIKYYGHLELPPGDYLVRVLARNGSNGRSSVQAVSLSVPTYEEQQTVVLPPFFLDDPGDWLLVRERLDEGQRDSVIYPFVVKGEPYIPAVRPNLKGRKGARFCLVAYNLGEEPQLEGTVRTVDGTPVSGGKLKLMERTITGIEGYDKILARFEPSNLAAGDYTLEVALRDATTGAPQISSIPFSVLD